MKTLSTLDDLKPYGLEYLTGEACALSQRFLFDMNDDGADLMCEYFGQWNSRVDGKTAVAYIMLPRDLEFYRGLFRFLLFREGYEVVAQLAGDMIGASQAEYDEHQDYMREAFATWRNPRLSSQPSVGTRNVHAATGRTT